MYEEVAKCGNLDVNITNDLQGKKNIKWRENLKFRREKYIQIFAFLIGNSIHDKIMYAHPQNVVVFKTYTRSQNNNAILKKEGPGRS